MSLCMATVVSVSSLFIYCLRWLYASIISAGRSNTPSMRTFYDDMRRIGLYHNMRRPIHNIPNSLLHRASYSVIIDGLSAVVCIFASQI